MGLIQVGIEPFRQLLPLIPQLPGAITETVEPAPVCRLRATPARQRVQ